MRVRTGILIFLASLMIIPAGVRAASSDFTITTQIVNDIMAPTTPNILSAVPIASTQINITWSASTDDVAVAGYRLFRDAVQIATTTLLLYSDTGLTASTTYSYTVDAFDTFGNISSTSGALATTTLVNPPPVATSTATSSGSSGTRTVPALVSITVITTTQNALFTWGTTVPTRYTLVWGRTPSYELGSVSGSIYNSSHSTTIDGLEPGTTYYYELRATNVRGITEVISRDRFMTQKPMNASQVPNVQAFTAKAQNADVVLSWQNPFIGPEYYVRVVRSHLFYPGTIQSGAVVYEGRGESFIDTGALATRSPQYYTIFVLNKDGSVSSGAVASVRKTIESNIGVPEDPIATSSTPADIGDDSILSAANITIVQNGRTYLFDEGLRLMIGEPYLISIPITAVARNLKSIIVSVQNPSNQREVSAYLLKLNQAGDAYTAYIPGARVVGTAGIMVEVFDYEQETVRRISTTLTFEGGMLPVPFFPDRAFQFLPYVLVVLLCSIILFLLIARRRRDRA